MMIDDYDKEIEKYYFKIRLGFKPQKSKKVFAKYVLFFFFC